MPVTNRKLKIFALVAEFGSISRAAAKLRLAQPVVSRAVSSLETDFGVKLCHRLAKGISLTEAGALLAREAQELLGRFEQLEGQIRDQVASPAGRIHLALSPSLAPVLAPTLIARFHEELPRMVPIIHEMNSSQAWTTMQSGALDLCLITSLEPDLDVEMEYLANEAVCLIGPNSPELAGRRRVDLTFVASLPLILSIRPHVMRRMLDAQFARLRLTPQVVAETDSLMSVNMALSGLGYTIYPQSSAYTFRSDPSLVAIPITGMRVTWTVAYLKSRAPTKAGRVCARLIREVSAEMIKRGEWNARIIHSSASKGVM